MIKLAECLPLFYDLGGGREFLLPWPDGRCVFLDCRWDEKELRSY